MRFPTAALVLALAMGCSWKRLTNRLNDNEFDHYYALRVYMDEDQQKTYLKKETEDERSAYLKELGLWDRFYKYPEKIRERIVSGEVTKGWTKDMLYMAWGNPFDTRQLAGRQAMRSQLLVYRFEEQSDGRVLVWTPDSKTEYKAIRLFVREVTVDDDVIAIIDEKDAHW